MPEKKLDQRAAPALAREQRLGHLASDERRVIVDLGLRVRALRRQRSVDALAAGLPKVTIAVLAEEAGINAAVLGEIERGRFNPSLMVLTRIARALGVTMAGLFEQCESDTTLSEPDA